MLSKNVLIPVFVVTIVGGTLLTVPQVHAQTTTPQVTQHTNFFQGLIQFLEQKFGLDKTQVQSAITEYQSQHPRPTMSPQVMQQREKTRLDKLVSQGKITSDQEQAILNELSSLQSKYNLNNQSVTPQQRQTQMQSMQNDLKTWAASQNINLQYVMPMFGRAGHRGFGMRGDRWGASPSRTPSATPTP